MSLSAAKLLYRILPCSARSSIVIIGILLFSSALLSFLYSPSHCIDSTIVACLRRVQEWSFVSILGELRMHSGCRQFDVEQFIESFNPDIVDISRDTPDYLQIHIRLKVRSVVILPAVIGIGIRGIPAES